ncbi:MAG TPA: HAD family hydrolase [Anaerolineaceae bacterium]
MPLFTADLHSAWIHFLHPQIRSRLGSIRHVLFDFDGTISVLRQGWEDVMIPLMVEEICGLPPGSPDGNPQIEAEVRAYVDRSSGILTIRQMQWLAEAAQRHGIARQVRTAREYKALYLERLMVRVGQRMHALANGESKAQANSIAGAEDFIRELARRGVRLYLASGTDHQDVLAEAGALGLLPYFAGHVYGALEDNEEHAKERVIQRILAENNLAGEALLVVGDGPVEIREGALRHALTLGVASNELARQGWNPAKVDRLVNAGADMLVADFKEYERLTALLFDAGPIIIEKSA